MKIVYIPQALYPALKKAGLQASDLQDIEKLLNTLSADDVAFYFFSNRPNHCPIPAPVVETLENLAANPAVGEDNEAVRVVLTKLRSLEHNGVSTNMYEENAVLTSDCTQEDLIIVTHTAPTDAEVGTTEENGETAFYDRIIRQLLAFQPLETVMGSPILLGWMKSVQADAKSPKA